MTRLPHNPFTFCKRFEGADNEGSSDNVENMHIISVNPTDSVGHEGRGLPNKKTAIGIPIFRPFFSASTSNK